MQSTALLSMSLCGYGGIPKIDGVVFSDTGWEPKAVYNHIEKLRGLCADHAVPFYTVRAGDLRTDALDPDHKFASMPLFITSDGKTAMLRRQCTREYKVRPIQKLLRSWGASVASPVELFIGISCDEVRRAKMSMVKYIAHGFPLLNAKLSRHDCIVYLKNKHPGWKVGKSSCIGCPFHDNRYWIELMKHSPAEFADACDFEASVQATFQERGKIGMVSLHSSGSPLRKAIEKLLAIEHAQPDLFEENLTSGCNGHCGL